MDASLCNTQRQHGPLRRQTTVCRAHEIVWVCGFDRTLGHGSVRQQNGRVGQTGGVSAPKKALLELKARLEAEFAAETNAAAAASRSPIKVTGAGDFQMPTPVCAENSEFGNIGDEGRPEQVVM